MSILKTIPISLDLKRVGAQSQALPTLVEGDNGNVFQITMTDDGEPLDLSSASRVICVFSKTSDGKTVEQDTEDANVFLDDYGITPVGTVDTNDTITVTSSLGTVTASVSGTITSATVDAEKFLAKFPNDGTYVYTYNGSSWQYGDHSVSISGTDNNIVTVALKSASFGAGTNNCEVQIYSGSNSDVLVTTANFNFKGRKGIMNDETLESEDKYPILVSLISQVQQALAKAMPYTSVTITAHHVNGAPTVQATITENSVAWSFGIPNGVHLGDSAPTGDEEVWIDTSGGQLASNLMTTDVYDTDEDGVVDNSEALNGHADTYFAKASDVSDIDTIRSNATNGQTAYTRSTDKVLYLSGVACSSMTGDFATVSNDKITADHVVAECTFSIPTAINGDITWTTAASSLVLNGTCVNNATTANIVLIKKDN